MVGRRRERESREIERRTQPDAPLARYLVGGRFELGSQPRRHAADRVVTPRVARRDHRFLVGVRSAALASTNKTSESRFAALAKA